MKIKIEGDTQHHKEFIDGLGWALVNDIGEIVEILHVPYDEHYFDNEYDSDYDYHSRDAEFDWARGYDFDDDRY